jgi:outer membrane protein OmpA-like peptidoglycan-associated protein
MRPLLSLLPWLLALSSCSSPPQPPGVDESRRRPANSTQAVELQSCRSELQNTRIAAAESSRLAESATATLARLHERQQAIATMVAGGTLPGTPNAVFSVHFTYGSAQADLEKMVPATLLAAARQAPLVMLRGRTDGNRDAPAESRIARQRAAAVREQLIAAGVDPKRIRETFQPSGDHAADNTTPAGRARNRRVEIEVYRSAPVHPGSDLAALPEPQRP